MDNADPVELPLDPEVARTKFAEAIESYRQQEQSYHARGCWLLAATFPKAVFAFAHPELKPTPVVLGAEFDFSNYDLWPISVRFVEPFKRVPYRAKGMPTLLLRAQPGAPVPVPLVQFHSEDDIPFLCLPGVREYHNHPAHTGDSWFLHRGGGEGTLAHLLSVVTDYGISSIRSYHFALNIAVNGFQFNAPA